MAKGGPRIRAKGRAADWARGAGRRRHRARAPPQVVYARRHGRPANQHCAICEGPTASGEAAASAPAPHVLNTNTTAGHAPARCHQLAVACPWTHFINFPNSLPGASITKHSKVDTRIVRRKHRSPRSPRGSSPAQSKIKVRCSCCRSQCPGSHSTSAGASTRPCRSSARSARSVPPGRRCPPLTRL